MKMGSAQARLLGLVLLALVLLVSLMAGFENLNPFGAAGVGAGRVLAVFGSYFALCVGLRLALPERRSLG
jgi:hypothetical protein